MRPCFLVLMALISAGCAATSVESPEDDARGRLAALAAEKLGEMPADESGLVAAGTREVLGRTVPWFLFPARGGGIEDESIWAKVPCPEGTKAAIVGTYSGHSWSESFSSRDDDTLFVSTGSCSAKVLSFKGCDDRQVGPGTGGMVPYGLRGYPWVSSFGKDGPKESPFHLGRRYVLCFNGAVPVPKRRKPGERAVSMGELLPLLVGVVEIVPVPD